MYLEVGGVISSGTYTITLQSGTDGNTVADKCGNFAPAGQSVQVPLLGTLSITITPSEVCATGTTPVQLVGNVQGGLPAGAVATWNTGASGLTAQDVPSVSQPYFEEPYWVYYTLTVALGGCTYAVTDSVRVHPLPRVEVVPPVVYTCGGRPVELTGLASILGGTWERLGSGGLWQPLTPSLTLSPGTHALRYVTAAGCLSETLQVQVIDATPAASGACNVLYVSPSGSATGAGTPADPLTLEAALDRLRCRKGLIKLAQGTYLLSRPLTTLTDSVILEGGYDPAAGWVKRSTPGLTVLRRTATNVEGCGSGFPRLTALQVHGAQAFRLQDLTIEVEAAPPATAACAEGRGVSTYGLYLRGCAGYEVVRCQVTVGDASAGEAGIAGQDGRPGGNGQCGGAGAEATPTFGICIPPFGTPPPASAGAGGAGGSSPVGNAGGRGGSSQFMADGTGGQAGSGPAGGAGGTAGALCFTGAIGGSNCACTQVPLPGIPPASGGDGQDGQPGADGQPGQDGTPGQVVEGFWRPGSRGRPGQDGGHGSGGGGGGAGG
ncbi:MAG: hypothetical protein D6750_10145, partial [Bacteroidetes bacterium]